MKFLGGTAEVNLSGSEASFTREQGLRQIKRPTGFSLSRWTAEKKLSGGTRQPGFSKDPRLELTALGVGMEFFGGGVDGSPGE